MMFIFSIAGILISAYLGLLAYYRFAWMETPVFSPSANTPKTKITVLIPARNEENNLPMLLDALKAQTYPLELFEVIVIDDHSTDNTAKTVMAHHNCRLLSLKDFIEAGEINSYKKKAIEIGIQHSVGELIVTTDADCYVQPEWLHTMASFYETHRPQLMVMPVCMFPPAKGQPLGETTLSIFQSLDFMTLQGITGASVFKKMHSMCNGANLAYTRNAFLSVRGFEGIDAIASGDDMLLMHKISMAYPNAISFVKSHHLIVKTQPMTTIKDFFHQRIRWASKADKYEDKRIFWVLLLVYIFNAAFILLPLLAIIQGIFWKNVENAAEIFSFFLLLLASKTAMEIWFLYPVAHFFGLRKLLWFFPLAQPFHIIYTIIAGWMGKFGTYQWKGRQVK